MGKLLIHIGMEKSGSTSIQTMLRANRRSLGRSNISFPIIEGRREHNFLASAYIDPGSSRLSRGLNRYPSEEREKRAASFRGGLLKKISGSSDAIISGEHLFRLDPGEIARFKADLERHSITETLVVGYIREPVSLYLSLVQQELKGDARVLQPGQFHVPYRKRIEGWRNHFETRFFDFNSIRTLEGGPARHLLEQAARFFGQDLSNCDASGAHYNESISAEEMQVLQDFRRYNFPEDNGRLNKETSRLLKAFPTVRNERWTKPKLKDDIIQTVRANHLSELAFLDSLFGTKLAREPVSAPSPVPEVLQIREILDAFDAFDAFDDEQYRAINARIALRLIREPSFNLTRKLKAFRAKIF